MERRHIIGGASVTEEIVPGFKFSRAAYVLSLLRPQIFKDLELKKHGLKVKKKIINFNILYKKKFFPTKKIGVSEEPQFLYPFASI